MSVNIKPVKTTKKLSLHAISAPKPQTIKISTTIVPKRCGEDRSTSCTDGCECKSRESILKQNVLSNCRGQLPKKVDPHRKSEPQLCPVKLSELKKQLRSMTITEQITKQLNVPSSKKLYKDLIPLEVNREAPAAPNVVRRQSLPKELEPDLANFFTPKKIPEYKHMGNARKKTCEMQEIYDGRRIYKVMQEWNDKPI